eukprot:m.1665843 g.1665843  ORF g.1665843 m.1665843 type:complete len:72 (+) comp143135_c0_seq1:107-322(+)
MDSIRTHYRSMPGRTSDSLTSCRLIKIRMLLLAVHTTSYTLSMTDMHLCAEEYQHLRQQSTVLYCRNACGS